jgi:hypothetical protein
MTADHEEACTGCALLYSDCAVLHYWLPFKSPCEWGRDCMACYGPHHKTPGVRSSPRLAILSCARAASIRQMSWCWRKAVEWRSGTAQLLGPRARTLLYVYGTASPAARGVTRSQFFKL